MRIAWFRKTPETHADPFDPTAPVIRALSAAHTVDVVTETRAHAFVVTHAQRPFDVCVFEARNDVGHEFIWAYLFSYAGVMVLLDRSLHDVRARSLERHRHAIAYAREFHFNHGYPPPVLEGTFARGTWPMLRAAGLASRLVVAFDPYRRAVLERTCPGITVRDVPHCAGAPINRPAETTRQSHPSMRVARLAGAQDLVRRAMTRTRDAGIAVDTWPQDGSTEPAWDADVFIALDTPGEEPRPTPALTAMALGKPVIVVERESTGGWPALDPQTWRPRDPMSRREPVVVSIDPRDEEHSLLLALKALARDPARRAALGRAARHWWLAHATPEYAASVWGRTLREASTLSAPAHPPDWPAHLTLDGFEGQRAIAGELGLDVTDVGLGR